MTSTLTLIASLTQHYLQAARMPRLFDADETVPIEAAYIHLQLVEEQGLRQADASQEERPTLSEARFQLQYGSGQRQLGEPVALTTLLGEPGRTIVVGRPGVGKSTLCKYITHAWSTHVAAATAGKLVSQKDEAGKISADSTIERIEELDWSAFDQQYRLILWIQLSELTNVELFPLKQADPPYALHEVVNRLCFGKLSRQRPLNNLTALEDLLESKPVLWLLDGFDEIARAYADYRRDPRFSRGAIMVVGELLHQPHYILTSRPGAASPRGGLLPHPARRVEITGFSDDNIRHYIDRFFAASPTPPRAQQIKHAQSRTKTRERHFGSI